MSAQPNVQTKHFTSLLGPKLDTNHAFIGRIDVMPATSFLEPLQHCVLDDGDIVGGVVTYASDDLHSDAQGATAAVRILVYRLFTVTPFY